MKDLEIGCLSWITGLGVTTGGGRYVKVRERRCDGRCYGGSRSWRNVIAGFEDERGP